MSTPKDSHQSKSFAFESSPEFLLYSDPKLSLITSQYATKATLFQYNSYCCRNIEVDMTSTSFYCCKYKVLCKSKSLYQSFIPDFFLICTAFPLL